LTSKHDLKEMYLIEELQRVDEAVKELRVELSELTRFVKQTSSFMVELQQTLKGVEYNNRRREELTVKEEQVLDSLASELR